MIANYTDVTIDAAMRAIVLHQKKGLSLTAARVAAFEDRPDIFATLLLLDDHASVKDETRRNAMLAARKFLDAPNDASARAGLLQYVSLPKTAKPAVHGQLPSLNQMNTSWGRVQATSQTTPKIASIAQDSAEHTARIIAMREAAIRASALAPKPSPSPSIAPLVKKPIVFNGQNEGINRFAAGIKLPGSKPSAAVGETKLPMQSALKVAEKPFPSARTYANGDPFGLIGAGTSAFEAGVAGQLAALNKK